MNRVDDFVDVHPDFVTNYTRWLGVWLQELPKYLGAEAPDLAKRFDRLSHRIRERARQHLGSNWVCYPARSYFRRHIGTTRRVPWHIDADAAGISRLQCVNVWLPLDTVGRGLPTLEVVPKSHFKMRLVPLMAEEDKYRDDAFVAGIGEPYAPILAPGDALLFNQYTLHRTQLAGAQNMVRTACEFRFEAA